MLLGILSYIVGEDVLAAEVGQIVESNKRLKQLLQSMNRKSFLVFYIYYSMNLF